MQIGAHPKTAQMMMILLHGYGSCGANMMSLAQALNLPEITFWCPDGPEVCSEYPDGRQWFSLKTMDWHSENLQYTWKSIVKPLHDAAKRFHTTMQNFMQAHDFFGPVVIGGFSQGAMMAYELGFFGPVVQAVIGFSGAYCLNGNPVHRPALFWTHSRDDAVVPFSWMLQSNTLLEQHGLHPQSHIYPTGGHSVSEDGLWAVQKFLKNLMSTAQSHPPY